MKGISFATGSQAASQRVVRLCTGISSLVLWIRLAKASRRITIWTGELGMHIPSTVILGRRTLCQFLMMIHGHVNLRLTDFLQNHFRTRSLCSKVHKWKTELVRTMLRWRPRCCDRYILIDDGTHLLLQCRVYSEGEVCQFGANW